MGIIVPIGIQDDKGKTYCPYCNLDIDMVYEDMLLNIEKVFSHNAICTTQLEHDTLLMEQLINHHNRAMNEIQNT